MPHNGRATAAAWLVWSAFLLRIQSSFSSSSTSVSTKSSVSCSICLDPQDNITLPNASFPLFGTCGDVDAAISFIAKDSDTCRLIQSVRSLCGCPISKSSCFLCGDSYDGPIDSSRPVPYLLNVPGIHVTCDIVQAYLHSIPTEKDTCTLMKSLVGPYCGCPSSSSSLSGDNGVITTTSSTTNPCALCKSGQAATLPNKSISTGLNLPFLKTCRDVEHVAQTYWRDGSSTCRAVQALGNYCGCSTTITSASPCTFCSDGSAVTLVNQTLHFLKDQFNLAGLAPTCGLVDAALQSVSSTDPLCSSVRLFGTYCGCPAIPDHCLYCPKPGDNVTKPDLVVKQFGILSKLNDVTCEDISWTQYQVPSTSDVCWMSQAKNYLCGCNGGVYDYLGADNVAKKAVLAWMPRLSAALSIFGALFIMSSVYWYHRSPLSQYHELVATMSLFDFMGSLATIFTTLPIPQYDRYGQPSSMYGALGNVATCRTQGFFVQLGFTGIFYTVALSVYYVLVVNYGYREHDMKKIRILFHIPLLLGFALAFAGIPHYANVFFVCHIHNPASGETYRYIDIFVFVPITTSIVSSAIAMIAVYLKVRSQSRASRRWRLSWRLENGGGTGGKLARKVFWQAFFFVLALYLSWPLLMIAEYFGSIRLFRLYWFWVVAFTMAPLQGFFNFLVYTRPKLMRYLKQRRRQRRRNTPQPRRQSWARRAMRMSSASDDDSPSDSGPPDEPPRSKVSDEDASDPVSGITMQEDSNDALTIVTQNKLSISPLSGT